MGKDGNYKDLDRHKIFNIFKSDDDLIKEKWPDQKSIVSIK